MADGPTVKVARTIRTICLPVSEAEYAEIVAGFESFIRHFHEERNLQGLANRIIAPGNLSASNRVDDVFTHLRPERGGTKASITG